MTCDLLAIGFRANDPRRLAGFWSDLLGWESFNAGAGITVGPRATNGIPLRFVATEETKSGPNQAHPDLTSESVEDQQRIVATALRLGARHIDVGQLPEDGHVVLADPEGNEFCVIEPGNAFLAGCGSLGALSCDGSQALGYFWSAALGWPLVWDRDEETAIQSPRGGPKISWGGPPLAPRTGETRLQLELVVSVDGDLLAEVDRLVSLGARVFDPERGGARVAMADPDGNNFGVRRHE